MAQHASAKKRARQDLVRRSRNRHVRATLRSAIKAVGTAASEGGEAASQALRSAERLIRKAASKGGLAKKQASRTVSRLTQRVNRASS
ncbi:MAG: 30S ribosomal protein S20 [Myxococcota bacterium]